MGWPEAQAVALHAEAGGSLYRLADLLPARLHEAPGILGLAVRWDDGTWDLWLPEDRPGRCHEYGHRALEHGYAKVLREEGVGSWRRERIREEGQARRFAETWLALDDD